MRPDLHTHLIPGDWQDFASRFGGARWPKLVRRDACRATIMTGEQFFRDVDSLTLSAANLKFIVEQFGVARVMLGSDCPFDMGSDDPVGALAEASLPAPARAQIEGDTAARFLGL